MFCQLVPARTADDGISKVPPFYPTARRGCRRVPKTLLLQPFPGLPHNTPIPLPILPRVRHVLAPFELLHPHGEPLRPRLVGVPLDAPPRHQPVALAVHIRPPRLACQAGPLVQGARHPRHGARPAPPQELVPEPVPRAQGVDQRGEEQPRDAGQPRREGQVARAVRELARARVEDDRVRRERGRRAERAAELLEGGAAAVGEGVDQQLGVRIRGGGRRRQIVVGESGPENGYSRSVLGGCAARAHKMPRFGAHEEDRRGRVQSLVLEDVFRYVRVAGAHPTR